ncbi:MAG: extracellular solute-binding protein [Nevskiaceae bacterium]|nr:MAG: extracellular solute-binding protein [Nevskiaceae bacterium]TBR72224.1 MAG: extracellular solute-binding protein [Nevskiaceae bacterium]
MGTSLRWSGVCNGAGAWRVVGALGVAVLLAVVVPAARPASAAGVLQVDYAGSMGTVMDTVLGPAFAKANDVRYRGKGQGSYGLARLIAGRQLRPDVFVAITPGPIRVVQQAGLMAEALPVASTRMVIAYSPKSRFAVEFAAAAAGRTPWYEVLQRKGLQFGRTDPLTDPQGRNIVLTMQLAALFYGQPELVARVLGAPVNPRQIFSEPSLLSRLEAGQVDAASGYRSAVVSHRLPYISLPDEIDLGDPAQEKTWYVRAGFTLPGPAGKPVRVTVQPLVFYAGVLKDAANPRAAHAFVDYLRSAAGQKSFAAFGYDPPRGAALVP